MKRNVDPGKPITSCASDKTLPWSGVIGYHPAPEEVVSSSLWQMRPTVDAVVGAVRAGAYKASNMRNYSMMAAGGAALAQINTGVRGGIPAELEASVLKKLEEIRTGAFVVPVDESVPAGSVIR